MLSFVLPLAMVSCGGEVSDSCEVSQVSIGRIDKLVSHFGELDSVSRVSLIDSMRPGLAVYLPIVGLSADSCDLESSIASLSESDAVRVFSPDVEISLGALDGVEVGLGDALRRLRALLPAVGTEHIYGVVLPYRQSVITADSVVLVALNLYLGSDYPGYAGFETYFRKTRVLSRLPYDVVEAVVAAKYPEDVEVAQTVLSKMLYQGALVHAVMSAITDAKLSSALGVTDEELEWLDANEGLIWRSMIDKNLLYSHSELDAAKLLTPSPAATVISSETPGRVGRYVGYKIVESYCKKHKAATLVEVLSPQFYGATKTLVDAGYAPKM